jgi:hypothetical protein
VYICVLDGTIECRNLCIDGGYDICGEMYNKNILAPLKAYVPKANLISSSLWIDLNPVIKISNALTRYLENPKSAAENAQKIVYELADNLITIFWCLS